MNFVITVKFQTVSFMILGKEELFMGNQSNNRPIEKPVLRYVHEDYGNKKADEIHERLTRLQKLMPGPVRIFRFPN